MKNCLKMLSIANKASVCQCRSSRQVLTCLPLKHLRECCLDPSPQKRSTDRHQTRGQRRPRQHEALQRGPGSRQQRQQPRAPTCCPLSTLAEKNPLDACLEDDAASNSPCLVVLDRRSCIETACIAPGPLPAAGSSDPCWCSSNAIV